MNVPKLRFREFSGEWEEKKYNEIYSFFSTNSFSRDNLNYETGTVRNIHYGDIHTKFSTIFDIEKENVPFVNNEIDLAKIKEENYCLVGDLVIADASEDYTDIGKTIEISNLNNEKVLAGLHTFLARPNKFDMALGYMGYSLQSQKTRKQIMTIAQGTKVLSLSTTRLGDIILDLPSKPEQQKIASFLTSVDTKIEQLTKKKTLLEQYKKGVMQKIFSQEIRFKNDDGSEYPEWVEKKLGEIAKRKTTKNKECNTNVLTISAQLGLISQLEFFNKSVSAKDVTGYYLLEKGDFAYNKSYSNGYPMGAIKSLKRYDKGVVSTLYICFSFDKCIDLSFMEQYFETGIQNKEIEKVAQEGARNHGLLNIGLEDFFSIKIHMPTLKEQTKIANFLSSLDSKLLHVEQQLNSTKQFKKALLQQMFV